jgi:hypothetical protein
MLAEAAAHIPVLAGVDDAQWLDDASSGRCSAARRVQYELVALLFAAREGDVQYGRGLRPPLYGPDTRRAMAVARSAPPKMGCNGTTSDVSPMAMP